MVANSDRQRHTLRRCSNPFFARPVGAYQRRHFRSTVAEITQLLLGLSIPLWLASHFGVVRLAGWIYGRDPVNYAAPLFAYWVLRQHMIAVQFTLLTIAWTMPVSVSISG